MITALLGILLLHGPARATSLLEASGGVIGRGEAFGSAQAERQARALVEEGDWARAALAWAEARRAGARAETAASWEVVALARAGEWELARLSALAAVARAPDSTEARLSFAWLMCEGGDPGTARKVARGYPLQGEDSVGVAVLELRSFHQKGRWGRAARARHRALAGQRIDAWLWLESGMGRLAQGDPEGLTDLEHATRAPGAGAPHALALAELRRSLGDTTLALRLAATGMERFPEDLRFPSLAVELALPDPEILDRLVSAEPERAALRELRGALRLSQDDPLGAREELSRAAELGRRTAASFALRARGEAMLGQVDQALALLGEAMIAYPRAVELGAQRFELAREGTDPAQVLAAVDAWEFALVHRGASLPAEAMRARAASLVDLRRGPEALQAYEEALVELPGDPGLLEAFAGFLLQPLPGVAPDPERAKALLLRAQAAPIGDSGGPEARTKAWNGVMPR